jgi:hypothetical protein
MRVRYNSLVEVAFIGIAIAIGIEIDFFVSIGCWVFLHASLLPPKRL